MGSVWLDNVVVFCLGYSDASLHGYWGLDSSVAYLDGLNFTKKFFGTGGAVHVAHLCVGLIVQREVCRAIDILQYLLKEDRINSLPQLLLNMWPACHSVYIIIAAYMHIGMHLSCSNPQVQR